MKISAILGSWVQHFSNPELLQLWQSHCCDFCLNNFDYWPSQQKIWKCPKIYPSLSLLHKYSLRSWLITNYFRTIFTGVTALPVLWVVWLRVCEVCLLGLILFLNQNFENVRILWMLYNELWQWVQEKKRTHSL